MQLKPGLGNMNKTDPAGFSLIECLISLSVFTIGILAVATLVLSSIGENAGARRITEATALAETSLEQLVAKPYDEIVDDEFAQGGYTIQIGVFFDRGKVTLAEFLYLFIVGVCECMQCLLVFIRQ